MLARLWNTVAVLMLDTLYWVFAIAVGISIIAVGLAAMYWFLRIVMLILDGLSIEGAWKAGTMFVLMLVVFIPLYVREKESVAKFCGPPLLKALRRIAGKAEEYRRRGTYRLF